MKRKIIQIAGSTQLVSLPRKWALAHKLKKGEELEVKEDGNSLIVSTGNVIGLGSVEVDITGMERTALMFLIRALYKNGYDEITLNFKNNKITNFVTGKTIDVRDIINREVARLNGMEIFHMREDNCVLRSLSDESPKVFDTMLRRVFLLTSEAIADLKEGFENKNPVLLESIQQKHDTITRFISYAQRLLHKGGMTQRKGSNDLYFILEVIDGLIDLIKFNARDLIRLKIKPNKNAVNIYDQIHKSFDLYYHLFYNFKLDDVTEINKLRYDTLKLLFKISSKMSRKELIVLTNVEHVLENIRKLTLATMAYKY